MRLLSRWGRQRYEFKSAQCEFHPVKDRETFRFARDSGSEPSLWSRIVQTAEAAVIKLDIINHVVNQTGLAKTKAERAVETVFEAIKEALTRGERIEFRGFGIFEVRPRKAGIARNPRGNIEVPIRPGKSIRFRPGKGLRDLE